MNDGVLVVNVVETGHTEKPVFSLALDLAREGNVPERVPGEQLPPQHHEPAAGAARERDEGAGQQRVAHEFVAEHQAITPSRGAACRTWSPT